MERPAAAPRPGIDPHVRDDDERLGHVFRRHMGLDSGRENLVKSGLEIRRLPPLGVPHHIAKLINQSSATDLNEVTPGRELHEQVVVRTLIDARKQQTKRQRRRDRHVVVAEHAAGSVRDDQGALERLAVVLLHLLPLGLDDRIEITGNTTPAAEVLPHEIVRIQRSGMDLLLALGHRLQISSHALLIVLEERFAIKRHSTGGHLGILDLAPAVLGHELLNHTDLPTKSTILALVLIDGQTEMIGSSDAESTGLLGRCVSRLDPFAKQRDRVSGQQVANIFVPLLLHGLPHVVLERRSDQSIQIVIATVHTDQIEVVDQSLGMTGGDVLKKTPECLPLTQSAANITGVKEDLRRKQRIHSVGVLEQADQTIVVRTAKSADDREQVQTGIRRSLQSLSSVLGIGVSAVNTGSVGERVLLIGLIHGRTKGGLGNAKDVGDVRSVFDVHNFDLHDSFNRLGLEI